jgi:hypothetical protein
MIPTYALRHWGTPALTCHQLAVAEANLATHRIPEWMWAACTSEPVGFNVDRRRVDLALPTPVFGAQRGYLLRCSWTEQRPSQTIGAQDPTTSRMREAYDIRLMQRYDDTLTPPSPEEILAWSLSSAADDLREVNAQLYREHHQLLTHHLSATWRAWNRRGRKARTPEARISAFLGHTDPTLARIGLEAASLLAGHRVAP